MRRGLKATTERMLLKALDFIGANDHVLRKNKKNGVVILAYHEVDRSNFEKHVDYMRAKGFVLVSMDQVARLLYARRATPRKSIAITFDDGWQSNYSQVYPVALEKRVPITIYLTSKAVTGEYKPWFQAAAELKVSGVENVPSESLLETMPPSERDRLLRELRTENKKRTFRSLTLSLEEVLEMGRSGMVAFGSHTCTHPDMDKISLEEAEKEIVESKKELESLTGRTVEHFAYPTGFFSPAFFKMLEKASYKTAVTTIAGKNDTSGPINPFGLNRICLSGADDAIILASKISGLWHGIHERKKGGA